MDESSLPVEESSPNAETETDNLLKPAMSTKETASFLGWTEEKLTSRRKREQAIEGKGYRFSYEKQGGKITWRAETLIEPKLPPNTSGESD